MVFVVEKEVLSVRRKQLIKIIQTSLADSELHSQAFVRRLLGAKYVSVLGPGYNDNFLSDEATYGGYPQVAFLGFNLKMGNRGTSSQEHISRFLLGLERLRNRSEKGLETFAGDDVALLGVAEGITQIEDELHQNEVEILKQWLLQIIGKKSTETFWSGRLRHLAGDLLDGRGRLRTLPICPEVSARALDITLRTIWPKLFAQIPPPSKETRKELLTELLTAEPPDGDPERAAVWLKTTDLLVERMVETLMPEQEAKAIVALGDIKAKLDYKATQQAKFDLWLSVVFLVIVGVILAALTYYLTWEVMDQWTFFIGFGAMLGSYIYFALTQREFSPVAIYKQMVLGYQKKLYQEFGFDVNDTNND